MTSKQAAHRIKNLDLIDSYNYLCEKCHVDCIETQESLREYVCRMIEEGIRVSHILAVIEDNTLAEFFECNLGNSMFAPTPIYNKEELIEVIFR